MREKVGKSRNTVFFEWCVALKGRKVGSLKRRVRSQLARREMKNCTPLWREAHFEVKIYKSPQLQSTFRSCAVEKVHAVVARSTFRSQNVKSTTCSDDVLTFRCRLAWQAHGIVHLVKSESLAELLRFWLFQVQKLRKSRWIAAFLMLSSSKIEEVSQNSFVSKLAEEQIDRQTDRQIDR